MRDDASTERASLDGMHGPGSLSIAAIGAGRLGAELIRHLARLELGRIDVYERDARTGDRLRPQHRVIDGDFWDELTLSRLDQYDFAVCAVEDEAAVRRLNQKCLIANVSMVVVGTRGATAVVHAYPFARAEDCACSECALPRDAKPVPLAALALNIDGQVGDAATAGLSTAETAGALAAAIVARVAAGVHGARSRRVTLDTVTGTGMAIELPRDPECPRCHDLERPMAIVHTRNRWVASVDALSACPDMLDHDVRLSEPIDGDDTDCYALRELARRFGLGPVPAKFALAQVGGRTVCLDFDDRLAAREPVVPTASAARRQSG
jgi:bacteriocin biosynthesis cyclodehydratase domain-containing protein